MLIDTQRILTFHGDTLDEAATMLREEIATLPLTARVTSLASGCDAGTFSGMAVVDLIPEVESTAPATNDPDKVTTLASVDPLPDSL